MSCGTQQEVAKRGDDVKYISERITNIAELEKLIEECYIQAQLLQKESKRVG